MVAYTQQNYITPQQYLTLECDTETKNEYRNGEIVAMPDAQLEHCRLTFEIAGELGSQLRGTPYRGFVSRMRVRIPQCNRYYYPDIAIACEPSHYENRDEMASLLNPTLIVEVFSPSTEEYDRGEKWECYQTLESLQIYILAAQDRPYIEVFTRQEDGSWLQETLEGLEATIHLASIGCTLPLAQVYANVSW